MTSAHGGLFQNLPDPPGRDAIDWSVWPEQSVKEKAPAGIVALERGQQSNWT